MKKRRLATILLMAVLIAVMLWIGVNREKAGEGAGNTQENGEGIQGGEGAEEPRKTYAQLRVDREGKLLEGWTETPCIVLDPGHGGFDPGKVGINDVPEKEVNLEVAKLVRDFLEASGVKVVMTREEDIALCGDEQDNRKVRDLKQRISIIEEAVPCAAVSIHQNSYPQESVHGAQVFYYVNSVEGKKLAENLQSRLSQEVDPENKRQVKDNNSYYLLKKTKVPLVIVECGFLSNWEEAEKLCTAEYREEVAWAVYLGIMDYLEEKGAG